MRTADEWATVMSDHDLPVNLAALVEEIAGDEQVHANQLIVDASDSGLETP